ncbi:MAG: VWA domain-containing protein [Myxococcales bacterium]|nr:VWA domain-containing protein [Myxococcales bacterium]
MVAKLAVALAAAAACTDTYLYDERREEAVPTDRALSIEGRFCTIGTNEVVRPIKILMALDASQSMKVSDPDGTRAKAVVELLDNLPTDPEIYVSVMLFAGSTTAFLTRSGRPEFEQLISLTPTDRLQIAQKLLNFTAPQNDPNRDSTDFVKPLSDIYALINRDIANAKLNATNQGAETAARYSVIFLSDGHPTNNQDDELLCGDAVVRIRQLKDLCEDVRVNTVHVFNPVQPVPSTCDLTNYQPPAVSSTCKFPALPPTTCPMLLINQDTQRLEKMAELGGGDFRDFRNNEPINFLDFRFGQVRRTYVVKDLVATNFSAPPGSPATLADSDGDRLTDAEEADAGTSPLLRDTDGDGFSDGVEVHFAKLGASFNPRQVRLPDGGGLDPGCPPVLRGVDADCDGLTDCDEQLVGTNGLRTDSDDDGVPDSIEWQMRTQAASDDLDQDPDNDGLTSRAEVRLHHDPLVVDSAKLSVTGYRYHLRADGPVDFEGRQCYELRVDNISLASTLADTRDGGTGRGAGFNDLYLSVAMMPGDDPVARTLVRGFRTQAARFPVGGIKSPVDGVIRVEPEDFVDRCESRKPAGSP